MIKRQKGYNPNWPWEIEIWRWGDKIPEWLIDRAKVNFIDAEGNITLATRDLSGGGYEILEAGTSETLVQLKSKEDYLYISLKTIPKLPSGFQLPIEQKNIRSITKKQLELLYV